MMSATSKHNEDLRQLEHFAPIALAFLLRYLTWAQALIFASLAIVYALYFSPRCLPVTQRPEETKRGFSTGKVAYAVSVFFLILLFPADKYLVAAVWANLSVGDAASNLVGRHFGRRHLPWNTQKTWTGTISAIILSSLISTILILWIGLPTDGSPSPMRAILYGFTVSIVCSTVETLPLPVDDNITICVAGSAFLQWLSRAGIPEESTLQTIEIGLALSSFAGITAFLLRAVTFGGMASGVLVGSLVYIAFGWFGFLLLGTFFVLGTAFSMVGYNEKQRRGTAQPDRGRRKASHVWGKGFAPLVAAISAIFLKSKDYITLGFVAAIAASLFDTSATELGQLLGRRPVLLTSFKSVDPGTAGAVSIEGSGVGFLCAGLICLEGYLSSMLTPCGVAWALVAASFSAHLESYLWASMNEVKARWSGQLLNGFHTTIAMLLAMLLARIRI